MNQSIARGGNLIINFYESIYVLSFSRKLPCITDLIPEQYGTAFLFYSLLLKGDSRYNSDRQCISYVIFTLACKSYQRMSTTSIIGTDLNWVVFSLTTERTSVGLNVALGAVSDESDAQTTDGEGLQSIIPAFGIPDAVISPHMRSGFLKGLEHCNGSYTASLCPV